MEIKSLTELENLAKEFIRQNPHGGVWGLSGNLGAGKTTFVRYCIQILLKKEIRVMSPTYVIHQSYEGDIPIHHFDLYRLENVDPESLRELQYFEFLEEAKEKRGFIFVEWPEKCSNQSALQLSGKINFSLYEKHRTVTINHF